VLISATASSSLALGLGEKLSREMNTLFSKTGGEDLLLNIRLGHSAWKSEKPEQVFAWVDLTAGCQTATEEKPATLNFSATMAFCKPTILSIAIELVASILMPSSF